MSHSRSPQKDGGEIRQGPLTVNVRELRRGPGQWSQVCFLSLDTRGLSENREEDKRRGDRTERRGRSEDRQRWRG